MPQPGPTVCLAVCWLVVLAPSVLSSALDQHQSPPLLSLSPAANNLAYSHDWLSEARQLDLLVRRLQIRLGVQVTDNWRAIRDPQRYVILKSKGAVRQILKSFRPIVEQVKELQEGIGVAAVETQLNTLDITSIDKMRTWVRYWDTVRKYVGQIGQLYAYFNEYVVDAADHDESLKASLNDFVSSLLFTRVRENLLATMLADFHENVMRPTANATLFSFLDTIFKEMENQNNLCSINQSPYQLMYNLYNIVALTELKGYAMLQFAYMTLRINNKGNFTLESKVSRESFEKEAQEKLNTVLEVLPGVSRTLRRCDPTKHKEGETFLRVKGFLQGYIENEVDMNERGTCRSQCSKYTFTESKGCYKDMFCAKQERCKGRIFDCEYYHADAWVCMSSDPDRRYDWIEYEDGTILGHDGKCSNKIKVDSWWRYVFWHCSYCLCKCDEIKPTSERYWALVAATADTNDGMVVTGTRFVKRDKVFHIQIQQAKALAEGGIDESTREWKEPDPISEEALINNSDIFTMSYEKRALDLDSLSAPEGYVLTGLKLRSIGGHLNLEVQATPIEFASGTLAPEKSIWIANDNTPASDKPRKLLPIVLPDIPTRLIGNNAVDGFDDEYIQFDTTSAHKDAQQTTVPYLDAQPVVVGPATWLSGAGLYHKGRVGFGGFVGLSLETYNFSSHLLPGKPDEQIEVKVQYVKAEGA